MAGKLYLCATPIGNLEDITFRVIRTLKEVDLIAAEDTRNSIKLLNHFEISTPMTSYHEYNKIDKGHYLIGLMQQGQQIALITDAGTPGISDPGEELVAMCHEAGIPVTSLPGPAACITALTISGLSTRRFAFEAFLPTDKKEKQAILEELKEETRTTILYEAPHRLVRTLEELVAALGNRRVTICRELTKKHETAFLTTLEDALEYYRQEDPRGECVIVMEGRSRREMIEEKQRAWEEMSLEEHMKIYEDQGIGRKDAMKMVAKDRGISKREVYQGLLENFYHDKRHERRTRIVGRRTRHDKFIGARHIPAVVGKEIGKSRHVDMGREFLHVAGVVARDEIFPHAAVWFLVPQVTFGRGVVGEFLGYACVFERGEQQMASLVSHAHKGAVGKDAVILQTDVQPHVGHAEAEAHVERLFVDQMGVRHVAQGEHPGTVEVAVLEQHATGARVADVEHHVDGAVGFRIVLEERNLGGRPGEQAQEIH